MLLAFAKPALFFISGHLAFIAMAVLLFAAG
jgi:hypothetical protein